MGVLSDKMSISFTVFLILGCAPSSNLLNGFPVADTSCPTGSASVLIGDGFMQTLCGCAGAGETNGTTFPTPGNLTCHLSLNPTVFYFYFLGTVLQHQIVSTGAQSFLSSPVSNPKDSHPILVYAVILNQSATTYSFIDIYSNMRGQIFIP